MHAVHHKHYEIAQLLAQYGANVNLRGQERIECLRYCQSDWYGMNVLCLIANKKMFSLKMYIVCVCVCVYILVFIAILTVLVQSGYVPSQ